MNGEPNDPNLGDLTTEEPDPLEPFKPVPEAVEQLVAAKAKPKPKAHKVNPPTKIVIINKTTEQSAPGLAKVLPAIVAALGKQLANDVFPVWGNVPVLELGTAPEDGASTIVLQDGLDVDGALGYHDEANGIPRGFIGVGVILANGGTNSTGPNSVSVTLSHELLEMIGDESANLWADGPDGSDYARELCDAVESDSYDIDGIAVSNFVYPAFFDPQADKTERLDRLGKLTKPFAMTSGGYQIKRAEPGAVSQIWGAHGQSKLVKIIGRHGGRDIGAVFGADYPTWKIRAKVEKLIKRVARTAKAP